MCDNTYQVWLSILMQYVNSYHSVPLDIYIIIIIIIIIMLSYI
jgi:threonine/homoserine/homoserine lactone efflux protein